MQRLAKTSENFSDVTLLCGPERVAVRAHRALLGAHSEVLSRMFHSGMAEAQTHKSLEAGPGKSAKARLPSRKKSATFGKARLPSDKTR